MGRTGEKFEIANQYERSHYARVINPETSDFVTEEFRFLEEVPFSDIESVGALGEDGFYVNVKDDLTTQKIIA